MTTEPPAASAAPAPGPERGDRGGVDRGSVRKAVDPDSFLGRLEDHERWRAADRRPWRRFTLALLAVAVATMLASAAVVAGVNPRGEFPWQTVAPVSSEDPAYKLWLLRHQAAPDVLVLGSSRSQKVAPDDIEEATGMTAFNFALADAYPEDALAVYDGVADDVRPREVLLGLDLNRLEPRGEQPLRTRHAFGPLHEGEGSVAEWAKATYGTWSPVYVRQAAVALAETVGLVGDGLVAFDRDGLAHYVPWETAVAAGTFDQEAELDEFITGREGYPDYVGLDEGHVAAVRELVARAQADNVTIRVWLTPVHPRVEESYGTADYPLYRAEAHDLLVSLCGEGVHAYDYSDLETFGGRPEWFFDGSHMMQENTREVVRSLYRDTADLCAQG